MQDWGREMGQGHGLEGVKNGQIRRGGALALPVFHQLGWGGSSGGFSPRDVQGCLWQVEWMHPASSLGSATWVRRREAEAPAWESFIAGGTSDCKSV